MAYRLLSALAEREMTPEAAEREQDERQGVLQDFWNRNRAEIRRRALEMALDDSKSTLDDLRGHERILDWLTGFIVTPENIDDIGWVMKEQFIDDFEKQAELELRRECGV